jgi:hypothetical protein
MTKVKFNNKITYYQIPYYDRYNWDLIDAIRKRDQIINKWENLVNNLLNKN